MVTQPSDHSPFLPESCGPGRGRLAEMGSGLTDGFGQMGLGLGLLVLEAVF